VVVAEVLNKAELVELVVTVNPFLTQPQVELLFQYKVIQSQLAQVAQVQLVLVQEHKVQVQFSLQSHLLAVA
jgi:hypothetical protein